MSGGEPLHSQQAARQQSNAVSLGGNERRQVDVTVGGRPLRLLVKGDFCWGDDEVLIDSDDDLTRGADWARDAYGVETLLPDLDSELRAGVRRLILGELQHFHAVDADRFKLGDYHKVMGEQDHRELIRRTKSFRYPVERLSIPVSLIEERISGILRATVTTSCPHLPPHAQRVGEAIFNLRLIRPGKPDNNPPHRDGWRPHLKGAINAYIPICGSDALSSLPLMPGSHRWKESEVERTAGGAEVDGIQFTVPAVVGLKSHPMELVRPNPGAGEVLLFSPYLIHGAGRNLNEDRTRVSLEMRFWRAS